MFSFLIFLSLGPEVSTIFDISIFRFFLCFPMGKSIFSYFDGLVVFFRKIALDFRKSSNQVLGLFQKSKNIASEKWQKRMPEVRQTPGAPWGPKGPHGTPWGPIGPHRAPIGPHGAPWGPMGTMGAPWAPMGPMGPHGAPPPPAAAPN